MNIEAIQPARPGEQLRPALFLDRDGVINVEKNYVSRIEDFEFIDGIFDLVRAALACGLVPVVITNQAGIGRGYYSEEQFHQLTAWMQEQFTAKGAPIAAVYHCPFHPENGVGPHLGDSFDRKPNPGMIFRAREQLGLDLNRSILVGDKLSDIQAGLNAGIPTNLLFSMGQEQGDNYQVIASLADVIDAIRNSRCAYD